MENYGDPGPKHTEDREGCGGAREGRLSFEEDREVPFQGSRSHFENCLYTNVVYDACSPGVSCFLLICSGHNLRPDLLFWLTIVIFRYEGKDNES